MRKFIAVFDGLKYSKSTRDYAITLAKQSNAHLVGVILNDITHHSFRIYDLVTDEGVSAAKTKRLLEKDEDIRKQAAKDFSASCSRAGIEFTIHSDRSIALQEVIHESIYADLLIMDRTESMTFYKDRPPTLFIKDILPSIQCPVLLVPHNHMEFDKIVLLYDGEPSSVFAIKMFSYTLPGLKTLDTEVVTVKDEDTNLHLPDNKLMKEFMRRHFENAHYNVLKGRASIEIMNFLGKGAKMPIVVLGAYERSAVSRWFRVSLADILLKNVNSALFIAHK